MIDDFNTFCEDFLLKCAELPTGAHLKPLDVVEFCNEHFPSVDPKYKTLVGQALSSKRLGSFITFLEGGGLFTINGNGLLEVDRIRERRRPKTLREIIKSVTRSDWIAIGALVVSLVALFND